MKKFLLMFAALMFVPTFAGCGSGGGDAEIAEETDDEGALGEESEEDYEAAMQEDDAANAGQEEN